MLDPVSVALKFGFLAILYLFLLWVSRSALKDLRGTRRDTPSADATGLHTAASVSRDPELTDARLVVERAPGHPPGVAYEIADGALLGRGDAVDIRLGDDPFASSRHAQISRQGSVVVVEDLGSTNGTYLNEERLAGPQPLHNGDRLRMGNSEFTYEAY